MEAHWENEASIGAYTFYIGEERQFSLYDVNVFHRDWRDHEKERFGPYEYRSSLTGLMNRTIKAESLEEAKAQALAIISEYYKKEIEYTEQHLKYCTNKAQLLEEIITAK